MNQGIPHQQNLEGIARVIVLPEAPSNRLVDLVPLVPKIKEALGGAQLGDVPRVWPP